MFNYIIVEQKKEIKFIKMLYNLKKSNQIKIKKIFKKIKDMFKI